MIWFRLEVTGGKFIENYGFLGGEKEMYFMTKCTCYSFDISGICCVHIYIQPYHYGCKKHNTVNGVWPMGIDLSWVVI